jgi:hypothetical protein
MLYSINDTTCTVHAAPDYGAKAFLQTKNSRRNSNFFYMHACTRHAVSLTPHAWCMQGHSHCMQNDVFKQLWKVKIIDKTAFALQKKHACSVIDTGCTVHVVSLTPNAKYVWHRIHNRQTIRATLAAFKAVLWIRTHFFRIWIRIRIHKLFLSDSDSNSDSDTNSDS